MEKILDRPATKGPIILLKKIEYLGDDLSRNTDEEERARRLSPASMKILRENGLHQLFLPKVLGGLEADPLTVARLVEAVASHNTAAGWSMMVSNVSSWWSWRLPEKGVETIHKERSDTMIAGAFHPPMAAVKTSDGFRINGRSPLASNVHEARWIFVTAMVMNEGQPVFHDGNPEVIGAMMRATDCQIIDTWYTSGMKATDSNDIAAKDVFVPDYLTFPLVPGLEPNRYFEGPLYRFPTIGASICCLITPVALAVASRAVNEVKELAGRKTSFGSVTPLRERGAVQSKIGRAEAMVRGGRAYLHEVIRATWHKTCAGDKIGLEEKAGLLLAATHVNQSCTQAVDLMYSVAGTAGIYLRNPICHLFADAQVIRQHGFANESRYETAAQAFLGLVPDLPALAL